MTTKDPTGPSSDRPAPPLAWRFQVRVLSSCSRSHTAIGAAYGTAKAGTAIAAVGSVNPGIVMVSLVPIVMAGILAIYGVIVAIIIALNLDGERVYTLQQGMLHLGAGLTAGLSSMASGYAIGVVGDAGVRGMLKQPRLFFGLVLILIFAEVLGLYGLIAAVMISFQAGQLSK